MRNFTVVRILKDRHERHLRILEHALRHTSRDAAPSAVFRSVVSITVRMDEVVECATELGVDIMKIDRCTDRKWVESVRQRVYREQDAEAAGRSDRQASR